MSPEAARKLVEYYRELRQASESDAHTGSYRVTVSGHTPAPRRPRPVAPAPACASAPRAAPPTHARPR